MTTKRGLAPGGATPIDRALRRARDASPFLRRIAAWPPIARLVSVALLARLVRTPIRFAWREVVTSPARAEYALRESGIRVWLRHGKPDVQNFDEVFYQRLYDLPPAVKDVLPPDRELVVVDLGANIGLAGAYFLGEFPRSCVVGFEPDPANADVHELALRSNDVGERWRLVRACAWVETGEMQFLAGGFAESRLALEEESGISLPTVDVLPYLDDADLVKMDIEGSEWRILSDPRFAQKAVPVLALEYHRILCPEPDSQAYARRLLTEAGYEVRSIFHDADGVGMLWAWRTPSEPG